MGPFPTELWVQIFKLLQKTDWLVLSITCSTFRYLAQRLLFKTIGLYEFMLVAPSLLARSIIEQPLLVDFIEVLSICLPYPIERGTKHPILDILATFSNLRKLRLDAVFIDHSIYGAIQRIPRLRLLRCRRCDIDDTLSLQHAWRNVPFGVDIIRPDEWHHSGWLALMPATLRSLTLDVSSPHTESVFGNLPTAHAPNLWQLALDVSSVSMTLIRFIADCHQLRRIKLLVGEGDIFPLQSLPIYAIPCLESFSGDAKYAALFIRGRPVHTASIHLGPGTPVDILEILRHSTVPVTTLMLYGVSLTRAVLTHAPKTLVYFTWKEQKLSSIMAWIRPLSALPNLHTLHAEAGSTEVAYEELFVREASASCRSVQEFRFSVHALMCEEDGIHIHSWRPRRDGKWEMEGTLKEPKFPAAVGYGEYD